MRVNLINLKWNGSEGYIKPTQYWDECHPVLKLDALQDWIAELQDFYEKTLIESHEYYEKKAKAKEHELAFPTLSKPIGQRKQSS